MGGSMSHRVSRATSQPVILRSPLVNVIYLLAATLAVVSLVCFSAEPCPADDELFLLRDKTEGRVFRGRDGGTLPYRLLVPDGYDKTRKYPLILFLHGAGERGSDNQKQLFHPDVLNLAEARHAARHPAFVVAPQCPEGEKWVDVDWSAVPHHKTPEEPSPSMRLTMELLEAIQKEYRIDPDRLYVTGLSMGGYGTFDLLVRRPRQFAAAVVVCGGADDSRAAEFAHVPLWIFHGERDGAVPVARSRSVVAALQKAGAKPRYTEYAGQGHPIWKRAYAEPGLGEWLFGQVRKAD